MISFQFHKSIAGVEDYDHLDMSGQIEPGSFVGIYGPSGAGKTTLLRMFAGLLRPDSGHLSVGKKILYDSARRTFIKPQDRRMGLVFQDYALFPQMTVMGNLRFGCRPGGEKHVDELIHVFELESLLAKKPQSLSGGQRQRLAVARALVNQPEVLLLDEPLAAVDHKLRIKLQQYLIEIHNRYQLTTLLVSHEVGEIFRLCKQVIGLENGKIVQNGAPSQLFSTFNLSGKFQFTGEILGIEKADTVFIITVLVEHALVRVIADAREATRLSVGNKVLLASKAFNPLIIKIDTDDPK